MKAVLKKNATVVVKLCPKNYLFCIPTIFLPQLFDIFTHIYLPYLRHYATLDYRWVLATSYIKPEPSKDHFKYEERPCSVLSCSPYPPQPVSMPAKVDRRGPLAKQAPSLPTGSMPAWEGKIIVPVKMEKT